MREAQFGSWPERQHQLMRYFGYLLATEYGEETLAMLEEWGWPVGPPDFREVPQEAEGLLMAVKRGDFLVGRGEVAAAEDHYREVLEVEGPLAPRARFGMLRVALARKDAQEAQRLREELGIVSDYWVLGPFHAKKRTAHVVLPPETRIDLKQPVRFGNETARWKVAKVEPTGYVNLQKKQGFGYPANACAFALTYLHVDGETPARVWLGSDDGHTLYVNGELAEKRATTRRFVFDDDFADVTLRPGWNRILLKVHNGSGAWGFLMRVTDRDGHPLQARFSAKNMEQRVRPYKRPKTKASKLVADCARWKRPSSASGNASRSIPTSPRTARRTSAGSSPPTSPAPTPWSWSWSSRPPARTACRRSSASRSTARTRTTRSRATPLSSTGTARSSAVTGTATTACSSCSRA
jgi:hypothetical protein